MSFLNWLLFAIAIFFAIAGICWNCLIEKKEDNLESHE